MADMADMAIMAGMPATVDMAGTITHPADRVAAAGDHPVDATDRRTG
jgi:hypothetical protein